MNCGPLGFLSLHSISSLDWALFGRGPSPSYLAHVPFCPVSMGWLVLLPCHCIAPTMISLILVLPLSLQAEAPASPFFTFFFWVSLASILVGPAYSMPWASLAHFIPRAFLAYFLLLPYLFHSHGFLLNPLDFLDPITTSLPLITFQATLQIY